MEIKGIQDPCFALTHSGHHVYIISLQRSCVSMVSRLVTFNLSYSFSYFKGPDIVTEQLNCWNRLNATYLIVFLMVIRRERAQWDVPCDAAIQQLRPFLPPTLHAYFMRAENRPGVVVVIQTLILLSLYLDTNSSHADTKHHPRRHQTSVTQTSNLQMEGTNSINSK